RAMQAEASHVASAPAPAVEPPHEPEILPVLEFLVSDDAPMALDEAQGVALDTQATLDAIDLIEVAAPVSDVSDEAFEGFEPQMLSALLPDAYPVLEVVTDELDASEEAAAESDAADEIDLAPLLE